MTFSLETLHANAHSAYRWAVTTLQVGMSLENERDTAEELVERSEEYGRWLDAFERATTLNDENSGAFEVFVDNFGVDTSDTGELDDACDSFESAYIGMKTPRDHAEDYVDDCGMLDGLPDLIKYNIDYDGIATDLEQGGDITYIDGHLFYSNW